MTNALKILRVRSAGYFDQTVRQDPRPLPTPHFWMIWNGKKNILVQNDPKTLSRGLTLYGAVSLHCNLVFD